MSRIVWFAAVCTFLSSAAQAGEKLELKAAKGLKLNFVVEQSTGFEMDRDGSTMSRASSSRVEYKIEVKEKSEEGMVLAISYGSVKSESESSRGDPFKFDSAKKTDDERSAAIRKAMESKITVKVDAKGKISEVKGFPESDRRRGGREGRGDRGGRGDQERKTREIVWQDDDRPRREGGGRGGQGQGRGSNRRGGFSRGGGGPVSASALSRDLVKILATGLQGKDLESGKTYRLGGERARSGRGGRGGRGGEGGERRERKRPEADGDASFKISLQDDDRPRQGQGGRGQGGQGGRRQGGRSFGGFGSSFGLKFDSVKKGLVSFSLVQTSRGDDAEEKKVGSASYSKADGLLQKLSYKNVTENEFRGNKMVSKSTLHIVRKG